MKSKETGLFSQKLYGDTKSSSPATFTPDSASLKVTWLSFAVNILLGLFKVLVGWLASSRALVADGLHSLTDLTSDLAVIFAVHYAPRPSDFDHNYGHQKVTSLVTIFIASLILLFCLGLIVDAVNALREGVSEGPGLLAFWAAIVSITVKEGMFHITRFVARKKKSRLLEANAWHHRTDSVSSIAVAVGVAVTWTLGPEWAFLDTLVAIVLALYLGYSTLPLFRDSLRDLMDAAPSAQRIDDIREHILPTPGVIAYHAFRVRQAGDQYLVDLHLQVDDDCTVKAGHRIAKQVKEKILKSHPEVVDVLIHIEPAEEKNQAQTRQGIHGSNLPKDKPLGDSPLPKDL